MEHTNLSLVNQTIAYGLLRATDQWLTAVIEPFSSVLPVCCFPFPAVRLPLQTSETTLGWIILESVSALYSRHTILTVYNM
jgi:hypothetical protein